MKPRVKICGLRRASDAALSVELGAHYLGVVMAPGSPRCATPGQARTIAQIAGGAAEVVLVFRQCSPAVIHRSCERASVHRVQVHGATLWGLAQLARLGLTVHPVYSIHPRAGQLPHIPSTDGAAPGGARRWQWRNGTALPLGAARRRRSGYDADRRRHHA